MHHVRTEAVMLEATHAVELELNVVLPPGFYAGTEAMPGGLGGLENHSAIRPESQKASQSDFACLSIQGQISR